MGVCFLLFAARCYASAAYAVMRCLCVCLSRLWILSKPINISSNFYRSMTAALRDRQLTVVGTVVNIFINHKW